MVKANPTYKVSTINPARPEKSSKPKAQRVADPGDAYKSSSADAYKGLLDGKPKAEAIDGGVLEEMHDASLNTEPVKDDYHSQMQNLLGSLMIGEARSRQPEDTVGDIPHVPDLEKEILANTTLHDQMEPVVERYAALEKVLIVMYDNLRAMLDPRNMSSLTTYEIRSLNQYKEQLNISLRECRAELKLSREYLKKQRENEALDNSLNDEGLDSQLEAEFEAIGS